MSMKRNTIRDTLWGNITLTEPLFNVYRCKEVQKLAGIKQLGPAYLVYPSAVHTRLNHSLGVYHLSKRIIEALERRTPDLKEIKTGEFLCAALLHDIGHFPYAHSLKELPLKSHEQLAAEMIQKNGELNSAILDAGMDPDKVAAIIDDSIATDDSDTLLFRRLLSGALDPDKLDYLNRDALFAGVPYGSQDAPFIINHLSLVDGKPVLDQSALGNVEHLLFSKYMMYRTVYWHKGTRSATAMIKRALLIALGEHALENEQLYGLDDRQFFTLADKKIHPAFSLLDRVNENRLLVPVIEEPYSSNMESLRNLEFRTEQENRIFKRLSARYPHLKRWEIVLDVPEPITFEADIDILTPDGSLKRFNEIDQLFSRDISSRFENSLQTVRLFAPEGTVI